MTRHIHADLYEEAANDTSIKWQKKSQDKWVDYMATVSNEVPCFDSLGEYRKKPREFQEGHWYPVVHYSRTLVLMYSDGGFYTSMEKDGSKWLVSELGDIGESLGKLKFGGK